MRLPSSSVHQPKRDSIHKRTTVPRAHIESHRKHLRSSDLLLRRTLLLELMENIVVKLVARSCEMRKEEFVHVSVIGMVGIAHTDSPLLRGRVGILDISHMTIRILQRTLLPRKQAYDVHHGTPKMQTAMTVVHVILRCHMLDITHASHTQNLQPAHPPSPYPFLLKPNKDPSTIYRYVISEPTRQPFQPPRIQK